MPIADLRRAIPRAVPGRTAKSVRSGPAPAQYRSSDSGEGLWRSLRSTRRLLDQLVKAARAKPNGRLNCPGGSSPGSELVRTWKGKTHRVMVVDDGFAYGGERFTSLSEIAIRITGTRWNGPRFFGLVSGQEEVHRWPLKSEQLPLRHLHPQIHRAWTRPGIQLARCPAGGLRGLHQEPGLAGMAASSPAL